MIQFNPWKHHLEFLREQINQRETNLNIMLTEFAQNYTNNKNTITDLYTGKISVNEIKKQIEQQLIVICVKEHFEYKKWIEEAERFRKITINDNSEWILREGETNELYVHIHPGKKSPLTIRTKLLSISSAVLAAAYCKFKNVPSISLQELNIIRAEFLQTSPIKNIKFNSSFKIIYKMLLNT